MCDIWLELPSSLWSPPSIQLASGFSALSVVASQPCAKLFALYNYLDPPRWGNRSIVVPTTHIYRFGSCLQHHLLFTSYAGLKHDGTRKRRGCEDQTLLKKTMELVSGGYEGSRHGRIRWGINVSGIRVHQRAICMNLDNLWEGGRW